jgi:hypothetical protein
MNATPAGGAAEPSDGHEIGAEVEVSGGADAVEGGDPDNRHARSSVPPPRSGANGLPRRTPTVHGSPAGPAEEPARDPEGRIFDPVDEATLNRLLSGLREI